MNKKIEKNEMTGSQSAIGDYIFHREENASRHKARVLISSNGKNRYNNTLYISVAIEPNNTFVLLEGDQEFIRDFHSKYEYEHEKFRFINGTLIVQAADIWGNEIELNITGE